MRGPSPERYADRPVKAPGVERRGPTTCVELRDHQVVHLQAPGGDIARTQGLESLFPATRKQDQARNDRIHIDTVLEVKGTVLAEDRRQVCKLLGAVFAPDVALFRDQHLDRDVVRVTKDRLGAGQDEFLHSHRLRRGTQCGLKL